MASLQEKFIRNIQKEKLFDHRYQILVAISGGLDSVVLTHLLKESGFKIVLAHVNFNLRGEESLRDKNFVLELAGEWELPIEIFDVDAGEYAREQNLSVQVAARQLRYNWFKQLQADERIFQQTGNNPKILVTAHHADDNVETMLMHFFRGTGIQGLRGMLPNQFGIVRPLLPFTREELHTYALANNLFWVEDSSNASLKYSRNYTRNIILPAVKEIFPSAENNLLQNLSRFREVELLYNESIERYCKKLLEPAGDEMLISILKLQKTPAHRSVLYEILKDYHFTSHQVDDVLMLLNSESGRFIQSNTHRVIRNRKWLVIAPIASGRSSIEVLEEDKSFLPYAGGTISWKLEKSAAREINTDPMSATFDAAKIKFPIILRRWKTGDYFYPLGMKRKKKISRFLIDIKLSGTEKEKVYVLEMDKKILWVVGYRIDDRFKIESSSKEKIVFTFESKKQ